LRLIGQRIATQDLELAMLELLWVVCLLVLPAFGLPLAAIGAILGLCEWGWDKPAGSMGSLWAFGAAIVLCLPLAVYLGPAVVEYLCR
jgi:hypothetical protein